MCTDQLFVYELIQIDKNDKYFAKLSTKLPCVQHVTIRNTNERLTFIHNMQNAGFTNN